MERKEGTIKANAMSAVSPPRAINIKDRIEKLRKESADFREEIVKRQKIDELCLIRRFTF